MQKRKQEIIVWEDFYAVDADGENGLGRTF
jgi:hypothetical protein